MSFPTCLIPKIFCRFEYFYEVVLHYYSHKWEIKANTLTIYCFSIAINLIHSINFFFWKFKKYYFLLKYVLKKSEVLQSYNKIGINIYVIVSFVKYIDRMRPTSISQYPTCCKYWIYNWYWLWRMIILKRKFTYKLWHGTTDTLRKYKGK